MMLRILLNKYHEGAAEGVLKNTAPNDIKSILNQDVKSNLPEAAFASPTEIIKRIHYSWFKPDLEKLPQKIANAAVSLLPEPQSSKLREALQIQLPPPSFSTAVKKHLLRSFFKRICKKDVMPLDYLPPSPMTYLAKMEKGDLIKVIDYLGLYDLAEEFRHIVHKAQIENIYKCLSKRQHAFLRQCMHQKEKLVTQNLKLDRWDGDCAKLTKLLHHRGTVRLGYALSGQHPDLLWHISRILDSGRGEKLLSYYQKEEIGVVTKALLLQVKNVTEYLNKTGKP